MWHVARGRHMVAERDGMGWHARGTLCSNRHAIKIILIITRHPTHALPSPGVPSAPRPTHHHMHAPVSLLWAAASPATASNAHHIATTTDKKKRCLLMMMMTMMRQSINWHVRHGLLGLHRVRLQHVCVGNLGRGPPLLLLLASLLQPRSHQLHQMHALLHTTVLTNTGTGLMLAVMRCRRCQ